MLKTRSSLLKRGRKFLPFFLLKKIFLAFILFILTDPIFAQRVVILKLNPNDCSNCLLAISEIRQWNNFDSLVILLPRLMEDERMEFLDKLEILDLARLTISDQVFFNNIGVGNTSYIQIKDSSEIILEEPLKLYNDYKWQLIRGGSLLAYPKISSAFEMKIFGNTIITLDRSNSKIKVFDKYLVRSRDFKFELDTFLIKKAFSAKFNSELEFKDFYSSGFASRMPKLVSKVKVVGFTLKNDTLTLLMDFMYLKPCIYKGQKDTCVFNFYSICHINPSGEYFFIPIKRKHEGTVLTYEPNQLGLYGTCLDWYKGELWVNNIKRSVDFNNTDRMVSQLINCDSNYIYSDPLKFNLPKLLLNYPFAFVSDYKIRGNFLLPAFTNEILDIEKNKYEKLNLITGDLAYLNNAKFEPGKPIQVNFRVIDFIINGEFARVLFAKERDYFISTYSIKNWELLNVIPLQLKDDNLRSSLLFENYKTIISAPKSCKCFERIWVN